MTVKETLIEYAVKTAKAGLVAGAGGNVSARDGDIVWMKPSGYAMDEMTADELCGIELKTGKQVSGGQRPSSEFGMHLGIYRKRPEINAVFHTHSPWASGVISSGAEFRPMFAEFINDLGRVVKIPYTTPTTRKLADAVEAVAATADTLFLVNHGIVAFGVSIKQAFYRALVVEDAAKSLVAACIVGKPVFLSQEQIGELETLETGAHRVKMMER